MKFKKRLKRISAFIAALAVFCIYCFSCTFVYADSYTINVDTSLLPSSGYASGSSYVLNTNAPGSFVSLSSGIIPSSFDISFDGDSVTVGVRCDWKVYSSSAWRTYYLVFRYNGVNLSTSYSSPTVIDASGTTSVTITTSGGYSSTTTFYFKLVNISPPTPTPDPSTPVPVDYNDTQFWNNMQNQATGIWGVLTATFNGIFNNTVLRNLAIYVPLFTLIVGLIVYAITMGGDNN